MIRVLLLEPDVWRSRGLASILSETGTMEVVRESDHQSLLALASAPDQLQPDVIGVSHRLVLDHGMGVISLLCETFSGCPVIVHSDVDAAEVAAQAFAAGARGYFVLSHAPALYPQAVSLVHSGKMWGPREAIALMAEHAADRSGEPARSDGLTADEQQLLALLNEGLSNKEIGQRLGLAEATIKARFNRLYKRFGVSTRLQLLTLAIRDDLLQSALSTPVASRR